MFRLDDNEKGAFHYLVGGAILVLVLRGAWYLLDAWQLSRSGELAALDVFRQGYPLLPYDAVVATGAGRAERLATGAVLAVVGSLFVACLCAAVARSRGKRPGAAARAGARYGFLPLLAWAWVSALFIPIRTATLRADGIHLTDRKALIADIPLPFTKTERLVPEAAVHRVVTALDTGSGAHQRVDLWLHTVDGDSLRIGSSAAGSESRMEHLQRASEAAALLERGGT